MTEQTSRKKNAAPPVWSRRRQAGKRDHVDDATLMKSVVDPTSSSQPGTSSD